MEDIKQIIQKRCPQRPIEEFELIMDTIQKFELNKEKVTITKVAEVIIPLSRNQVAARIKVLEELKLIKIRRSLTGKRPVFLYIDGKSISNDRNEKIEIKLKVLLSQIKLELEKFLEQLLLMDFEKLYILHLLEKKILINC